MAQGIWLFVAEREDKWKVSAICSCCGKTIDKAFKYIDEKHQEDFARDNLYCKKCGAKMEMNK